MPHITWPEDRNCFAPGIRATLLRKLEPMLPGWLARHELPPTLRDTVTDVYLPLAACLNRSIEANGCRVLGLSGGQGAGKSTLSGLLVELLNHGFGKKAVTFSIDDIYLTRSERRRLADDIHPLLATRGVPGTHDPLLGLYLLQQLRTAGAGDMVHLPVFDKAIDDRLPPDRWRVESGPFDLVIFEGWCVGAMPQTDRELRDPINELERDEDGDGTWRRFVNDELSGPYIDLFAAIDILLMLQVPGMEQVFRWRVNQEEQLRRQRRADRSARRVMNEKQIRRFVQHYERITRSMLAEMPERADVVFELNSDQRLDRVTVRSGL